ncbi:hypothetical protein [Limisphaera sp. VF-2]|jgi:hypothetical protein|uniref:hypothetical protein n=1 Tax=Limisphaera sp. VF-2 TaxID=3400418 RepID=UPI0017552D82|nr:hypothetical protein [Limisphaera sp.]
MRNRLIRLVTGWLLMASGAAILLEAGLPSSAWPRSQMFLNFQGLAGFCLLALGMWLRRAALKSSEPMT